MAEFPASAKTMVGNNSGSCLLHLTGAAITVKFTHANESASWPYNCIRQFRADEDTQQFSFFSGRRGPYGVAEYKFDMTEQMLLALQDALTQFTGAQFSGSVIGSQSTSGIPGGNLGSANEQFRSPKRDPLPNIPGTPPTNTDLHHGYTTHELRSLNQQNHSYSATDVFATISREQRHRHNSSSVSRPPVPIPYNSHTLGTRGQRAAPSINTKYHEVAVNFPPQGGRGAGTTVPPFFPVSSNRKMSQGDEMFRSKTLSPARAAKLTRQATAPTNRIRQTIEESESPHQGGIFSPAHGIDHNTSVDDDEGVSDLDFGTTLRRSSPQVDRKNTTRRGRISPPDTTSAPHQDFYSVPRPSGSTSSPPLTTTAPGTPDRLYQVPRPNTGDHLSQESADIPTSFAMSPTSKDNMYSVPKPFGNGSDLYSAPRPQRQASTEELPNTPDTGGTVIYNVPSSRPVVVGVTSQPQAMVRPPQDNSHDLYNTPRPTPVGNGHEFYNTPRAALGNGITLPSGGSDASHNGDSAGNHEVYNVPRAALESNAQLGEDSVDKVPRSLEAPTDTYSVPKPTQKRKNYDSLEAVHNSADYKANNGSVAPLSIHDHASIREPMGVAPLSIHDHASIREPMPTPDQDTYSVPRPSNSSSPSNKRRYAYDYVDHTLPRTVNGRLKSSRSLESLVRNRVTLSPENPTTERSYLTPSQRALRHKYIEIDLSSRPSSTSPNRHQRQQNGQVVKNDNLYAEIPDTQIRRSSSPTTITYQTDPNRYATVPSNLRASAINNTPLPSQEQMSSTNAIHNVSKEARALHEEEGYELVLPVHKTARNLAIQKQATLPMNIGRTYSTSQSSRHTITNGRHPGNLAVTQYSTSGPQGQSPGTDEYVIVNRRDFNQPTQPKDIPVPLPQAHSNNFTSQILNTSTPSSRPIAEDEYEVMTSVKKQVSTLGGNNGELSNVPPVPIKKHGSLSNRHSSVSIPNSLPRSDLIGRQSLRNSLDLESIETGSRTSTCSSNHLDELVGPLSPIYSGVHPLGIPEKKNVIRIASGSPHDITPSKHLKIRSNSIENILDENEVEKNQKYENVTDEDLAAKHALAASTQASDGPKKPPMPLPRPSKPEH